MRIVISGIPIDVQKKNIKNMQAQKLIVELKNSTIQTMMFKLVEIGLSISKLFTSLILKFVALEVLVLPE